MTSRHHRSMKQWLSHHVRRSLPPAIPRPATPPPKTPNSASSTPATPLHTGTPDPHRNPNDTRKHDTPPAQPNRRPTAIKEQATGSSRSEVRGEPTTTNPDDYSALSKEEGDWYLRISKQSEGVGVSKEEDLSVDWSGFRSIDAVMMKGK